jgi:hypothetical protein
MGMLLWGNDKKKEKRKKKKVIIRRKYLKVNDFIAFYLFFNQYKT